MTDKEKELVLKIARCVLSEFDAECDGEDTSANIDISALNDIVLLRYYVRLYELLEYEMAKNISRIDSCIDRIMQKQKYYAFEDKVLKDVFGDDVEIIHREEGENFMYVVKFSDTELEFADFNQVVSYFKENSEMVENEGVSVCYKGDGSNGKEQIVEDIQP